MLSILRSARVNAPSFARGLHATGARLSYPVSKSGKPLGPFMRFSKEKRPEILRSQPDLSVPQQGAELGKLWRELSESERQRYKEEYWAATGKTN